MNLIHRASVDRDIHFEKGLPCPLCGLQEDLCECIKQDPYKREAEDES